MAWPRSLITGAILGVTLFTSACGSEVGEPRSATTTTPLKTENTLADAESGVSVQYPFDWSATTQPLTELVWPPQRIAVASYPLQQSNPDANCSPVSALESLPDDEAFIFLLEYEDEPKVFESGESSEFPSRPQRFRLDEQTLADYECFGRSYMMRFRDAGRRFQAHVTLGARASRRTREDVLAVLDSLEIESLEP